MGGRTAALCAAVVTTVCALIAALLMIAIDRDEQPITDSTAAQEAAAAARLTDELTEKAPNPKTLPSLGVQFHGTWTHYDDEERDAVLDKLEQSGATWVRLDVSWAMIQPDGPGEYDTDWGVPFVDDVIDELEQRDLKVLVMFWMTPEWANKGGGEFQSPTDPQDFARAIGWAADRWGQQVDAWEIWNEPNLESYYKGTDARTYTDLLCAAYPAVHRNDPSSKVLFGGMMFSDDAWLDRAYRAGVKGCFDVMAVHSYQAPADQPPSMVNTGEVWNLTHLRAVRDVMVAHEDMHPVWITEFGWSVHENEADTEPWQRGVSEEEQAEYGVEFLTLVAKEFPFVRNAFWYKDVENQLSTDVHQEGFAMLEDDLTPRPVYNAFRQLYGIG